MSYCFIENQWGEKYLEDLNRDDFTKMNSDTFFDTLLDYNLAVDNILFVIIGSDSGLLLPYLAKQELGRGSRIVVVEHDDVYPLIAAEYRGLLSNPEVGSADDGSSISLHRSSNWVDEVFDGTDELWLIAGQLRLLESRASVSDYSRIYMPILKHAKLACEERVQQISVTINRNIFSEMQFRNAIENCTPMRKSTDFGKGKTAVILAGGPSLDNYLEWVKGNRSKLFIIAVSRIAKKLMKHELVPDLVATVDPYDISYEICKLGLLWTDVPLVCNYHASPRLLQQWQGPVFYLGRRFPWHDKKLYEDCVDPAGPTVSHAATVMASQLGFTQILLAGVDLCFNASASTHFEGSPEQMIQQLPSICDAQVETYGGRIAGTSVQFKQSVDSLEHIGAIVNEVKPVLLNVSAEAAKCPSIPFRAIDDIQLPDSKPDLADHMDLSMTNVSLADLALLEKEIKTANHKLSNMRLMCSKAKDCVKRMHDPQGGVTARKNSNRLTKIRKQLENEYGDFIGAILYDKGLEFSKVNTPMDFSQMTPEELVDWGCHYYNLVDEGAADMMAHIKTMHPRIQLRRDEQDPTICVRTLAKRWREDNTPGRILRWKTLYWKNVAPKDRAWVQRAIGKFRSTLNEPDALVQSSLSSHNEDVNKVLRSLVFLRTNNSLTELQAIEAKLDAEQWPYSALKLFTAALICDLQNEKSHAMALFNACIDACSIRLEKNPDDMESMQRLIEDCLVRMTQTALESEDYSSALTTLGMLCEMLPSYIVSYAKMLHMCGQHDFSIELLESYVELYPANKPAKFVLDGFKGEQIEEPSLTDDPVYVQKITGAMDAIMGNPDANAA